MNAKKISLLLFYFLRNKVFWGLLIIPLFSLILYTSAINEESIWHDEWCTVNVIEQPDFLSFFQEMIETENNPPVYYFLLRLWTFNGRYTGPVHIRLLSSVFAVLTVALVFVLGKKLFCDSIAITASFLTALSPFIFWYAQEARNVSLTAFVSILCVTVFYYYVSSGGKRKFFVWAVLTMTLGVYTHYFLFFFMPAQLLFCFYVDKRKMFPQWCIGLFLVCLAFSFWIPGLIAQTKDFHSDWLGAPKFDLFWHIIRNFSSGLVHKHKNCALIITVLFCILFVIGVTGIPHRIINKRSDRQMTQARKFILTFFFIPILIPVIISFFKPIVFQGQRYLIYVLPLFLLIIAYGIYSLKNIKVIAFVLVLIFCLNFVSLNDLFCIRQKRQWRAVACAIKRLSKPGDAVFSVDYTYGKILTYYGIGNAGLCNISQIEFCENALKSYNRLWYVTFIPNCPYKKVLDKKYPLLAEQRINSYGGMFIKLVLYDISIPE